MRLNSNHKGWKVIMPKNHNEVEEDIVPDENGAYRNEDDRLDAEEQFLRLAMEEQG